MVRSRVNETVGDGRRGRYIFELAQVRSTLRMTGFGARRANHYEGFSLICLLDHFEENESDRVILFFYQAPFELSAKRLPAGMPEPDAVEKNVDQPLSTSQSRRLAQCHSRARG